MNSLSELRPVGTTWHEQFPPFEDSTDPRWQIFTYQVKEHVMCARYFGDAIGELREAVECIAIEYKDEQDSAEAQLQPRLLGLK